VPDQLTKAQIDEIAQNTKRAMETFKTRNGREPIGDEIVKEYARNLQAHNRSVNEKQSEVLVNGVLAILGTFAGIGVLILLVLYILVK
jgi:hypothetical protein